MADLPNYKGKTVKLNTGAKIPQLGFGTWQSAPGEVGTAVYEALKAGYRHLDLARIYQNQPEVAEGMKRAISEVPGLKREDIFITSKLWNIDHRPQDVGPALDECLQELQLDYLDLYLIHWPVAFKHNGRELFPKKNENEIDLDMNVSLVDTWKAMLELPKSKAKAVGVSNFTVEMLETIIKATGVTPAANQVERHPLIPDLRLMEYCAQKGIHVTAYSAFGNNTVGEPLLITHPEIKKIAEKLGVTPANVIIAWSQRGDHSVIPKSVTPSRIRDNFKEIELSPEDVQAIDAIGKNPKRYNVPYSYNPKWNINIWNDEKEVGATQTPVIG